MLKVSGPSWFSKISPNSRISFGFSKFLARAGSYSATNNGSFFGNVAMNAASIVRLWSSRWQVPQVRPLPLKVSLKNSSRPLMTRGSPTCLGGGGGGSAVGGVCVSHAESRIINPVSEAQRRKSYAFMALPPSMKNQIHFTVMRNLLPTKRWHSCQSELIRLLCSYSCINSYYLKLDFLYSLQAKLTRIIFINF
jgi:hypothetical protein